jgi:hypothetical protein
MSIKISGHRKKLHQLQDDLESFVHVLVYTSLRYCQSNINEAPLRRIFTKAFGPYDCSADKYHLYMDPDEWFKIELRFSGLMPLTDWIVKAMRHVQEWTRSPYAKMKLPDGPTGADELDESARPYRSIYQASDDTTTPEFRNHAALKNLWEECLQKERWKGLDDRRAAHDNFSKGDALASQPQTGKKRHAEGEIEHPASPKKVKSHSDSPDQARSKRSEGGAGNRKSTRLQAAANRVPSASK